MERIYNAFVEQFGEESATPMFLLTAMVAGPVLLVVIVVVISLLLSLFELLANFL